MIFLPTPHLTAESLLVAPTPIIPPDIVCVVLTGIPNLAVKNSIAAAPVSAENPWYGSSLVILVAIVRKRLGLGISLYTFLQVLSVSLFEKTPILQAFQHTEAGSSLLPSANQLNLFHF